MDRSAVRMRLLLTPVLVKTADEQEEFVEISLKVEREIFLKIAEVSRMAGLMHGPSAEFVRLIADAVDNDWSEVVIGGVKYDEDKDNAGSVGAS